MAKKSLSYHDRFTRAMLANPRVIEEFFRKNLPDQVRDSLDFSSIQLQQESFIGDNLKTQIVDLLYKADFHGRPGFLYLLIEHASKADPLLPFRLLKYIVAIMEHHLKTTETKELPLVYPLILYTGKRPYNHTVDLFDLFPKEDRDMARETLMSPYHLVDLTQVSDNELRMHLWYGTMAQVLKHIYDEDIYPFFKVLIEPLKVIEVQGEESYINTIVTYVMGFGEEDLYKVVKTLKTVDEEKLMTLAEYLKPKIYQRGIEQGLEQGLEKGLEKGLEQGLAEGAEKSKIEIARSMLVKGTDTEFIMSVTGLSQEEITKLMN